MMNALIIAAVFIFSFLPAVLPFFSNTAHHTTYNRVSGFAKDQHAHFSHGTHDVSWNIVRNHQLSSPPHPVKVKAVAVVSLLLAFLFFSILCALMPLYKRLLNPVPLTFIHRYLINRTLLI